MRKKNTILKVLYVQEVSIDEALELQPIPKGGKLRFLCEECESRLTPLSISTADNGAVTPPHFKHFPYVEGQKKCSMRLKGSEGHKDT